MKFQPDKNARMTILYTTITTWCFILSILGVNGFISSCYLSATVKLNVPWSASHPSNVRHQKHQLMAATIEVNSSLDKNDMLSGKTSEVSSALDDDDNSSWECNEEAECVKVPACDEEKCRTSLDVRIHNTWYDLSGMSFMWACCSF